MIFIKKILIIGLFFLGIISVVNIFNPGLLNKIKTAILGISSFKQQDKKAADLTTDLSNVLSEQVVNQNQVKEIVQDKLKGVSTQIAKQEQVQEITNIINKVVTEKVTETQKLSEQQIEDLKKELRRQVYQEVCNSWLKE